MASPEVSSPNRQVLYVEDDDASRYLLRRALERAASQVIDAQPDGFFELPQREQMAALLERLAAATNQQ